MINSSCVIPLGDVKTAEEAIEKAGLTWIAEEQAMITTSGISVSTHKSIVRSDNSQIIGVVGVDYKPLQNLYAFGFFDSVLEKYDASFENAYIINGGSKIILRAKLNGNIAIRKGDEVVRKIDIINAFDGGSKWMAQFTVYRLICSNGLYGFGKENKVAIRHTKNAEANLQEAVRVFAKSENFFNKFETACKALVAKQITKRKVDNFLKQIEGEAKSTRKENIHNKVCELYDAGKGTGKGTAWDLYNAYTEWLDHYRSTNEDVRTHNQVIGTVAKKEKAFDILVNLK